MSVQLVPLQVALGCQLVYMFGSGFRRSDPDQQDARQAWRDDGDTATVSCRAYAA